jgi:P27 family predicted phage terminase small subunit
MKSKRPKPIGPLNKDGLKFYNDICKYLIANDLIQDIDGILIYQAAKWWEIYIASAKGVERNGTTVVYASGHQQVSPDVTNMMKAHVAFNKLLDKLGIGEAARQKLKMGTGSDEKDPMDNI